MKELSINNFKKEVSFFYRGEHYLVRDNGAVYRLGRTNERKRRLDGVWTRGRQCATNGYMRLSGLVVHKIVATAFYGDQPSLAHVVDHLDTNRRNNRVENLRWVTRFENLANNPKTKRRIEQKWGSIEAMLKDPNRAEKIEPLSKRSWMPLNAETTINCQSDIDSYTSLAFQRRWQTPNAFPLCPNEITDQSLRIYLKQLEVGSVFAHNKFGECLVEMAAIGENGLFISVVSKIYGGVKGWGLAKIFLEKGRFIHEAHGTFFTLEGAEKSHCEHIGEKWDCGDSIDDYC